MTREIKLKVWDKKHGIMLEPIELKKLLKYLVFQIMPNSDAYELMKSNFDDLEWIQWTGLKDKNGKDIYEGDIIDFKHHKGYLLDDCVGVMEWIVCEYVIKTSSFVKPVTIHLSIIDELQEDLLNHIEVIGNIYEHSYLLDNK